MKIAVINGSPHGNTSVTLQTVKYIEAVFSEMGHEFTILNVGQRIKQYEKDMSEAKKTLEAADMLIFAYPVYTFIAPYQLHRFVEMLKSEKVQISGKFATQITTSKHFFDVTAHRYIEENCNDMGLHNIKGLSADMDDLLTEKGRKEAEAYFRYVMFCVENKVFEQNRSRTNEPTHYVKTTENEVPDIFAVPNKAVQDFGLPCPVVVTNCEEGDTALSDMISDFCAVFPGDVRVVNINKYPFDGGCLGCFNCAVDGKCIYRDGFDRFLRENIQKASAIVYAFTIKDHSMGASFKRYDDRQFCNGHRTVTAGMPFGYIVNGDYASEANLKVIIEGRSEVGGNFLAGVATDFDGIVMLSKSLVYSLENKPLLPRNFYGVGGMKIFRDLIYVMRGMMKADHKFYKKHGIYDFPQKKVGTILKMKLVGALLSIPGAKEKIGGLTKQMSAPYEKVIPKKK